MFMKLNANSLLIVLTAALLLFPSCNKEPEPVLYYDHVQPYELVEETFRLGARSTAGISNNAFIVRSFKLPPRTVYWAYWLGAGPEPVEELARVAIPAAASRLTQDPFIAYAWGLIAGIPLAPHGAATADLFFLDENQSNLFWFNDQAFSAFIQKPQSKNVHERYIDILDTPMDSDRKVTVGLRNQNYLRGVDVKLKIWAFVVKPL
jgi:hypothetical protein